MNDDLPVQHSGIPGKSSRGRASNPQGGLFQVSQIEVVEPKVPQRPHTAKDSWVLLPQFTPGAN